MTPNFTPRSQQIIATSKKLAEKYKDEVIDLEHLFLAILKSDSLILPFLISRYGIDYESLVNLVEDSLEKDPLDINTPAASDLKMESMKFSKQYQSCLEAALNLSNLKTHNFVSVEHIFYGMIVEKNSIIPEFFLVLDIDVEDINLDLTGSTAETNVAIRYVLWAIAINDFIQSPLIGVGATRYDDDPLVLLTFPEISDEERLNFESPEFLESFLIKVNVGDFQKHTDQHAHNLFLKSLFQYHAF